MDKKKTCPDGKELYEPTNRCRKIKKIKEPKPRREAGRPAGISKKKEIELFPKLTPELKELKKYIGSLIEPSRFYSIDWIINNIEKSGDSYNKKKANAEEELDYFKEIYFDVSNRRNENLRSKTRQKIDKYLEFEKNRIDKITEYISKLNQIIFNLKEEIKLKRKTKKEPIQEPPKSIIPEPPKPIIPEPPKPIIEEPKPIIKKPRGRPPKSIIPEPPKPIIPEPPKPIIEEPKPIIKKPRGRPPKVKPEPPKPIIPEPPKPIIEKPKGRPKKIIEPPKKLVEEVKEEIKKNKLVCADINVIPQFTGSCWFNSILMSLLYSQNSRKILLKISKSWDKKDKLFNIFKTILNRNYTDNDFKKWLNNIKPELILFEFLNKYDKKMLENIKKRVAKSQNISNFGFNHSYIVKILDYIIPDNKLHINFYNNKAYLNIDKLLMYKIDKNLNIIQNYNNIYDKDIINKLEDYNNKKFLDIPDYIIIDNTKNYDIINKFVNDLKDVDRMKQVLDFKYYKSYNKDLENALDNFKKGMLEVNYRNNVYKLDSILLSNEIRKQYTQGGHSISGITCDNERYIYNGWDSFTLDNAKSQEDIKEEEKDPLSNEEKVLGKRIATPCSLIKYDWDLSKKHNEFTLDSKKCELPSKLSNTQLSFNINSNNKILIYVKTNDEIEENDDLDDIEKIEIDVENFIKEILKKMPEFDIKFNAIIILSKNDISDQNIQKNATYVNTLTNNQRYKIVYDYLYDKYQISNI
jgi:hypothetical protein